MSQPGERVLNYTDPSLNPRPKRGRRIIGWVLFIGLAVMFVLLLNRGESAYSPVSFRTFYTHASNGDVKWVRLETNEVVGEFFQPATIDSTPVLKFRTALPEGLSSDWAFNKWLLDQHGIADVQVGQSGNIWLQVLLPLVPWVLIVAFVYFFVFRQLRRNTGQPLRATPVYIVEQPRPGTTTPNQ